MAVLSQTWECPVCRDYCNVYIRARPRRWTTQRLLLYLRTTRLRMWLRGWTYVPVPSVWLCPTCALTPEASVALAVLGGRRFRYADSPRWDYVFWHALGRLWRSLPWR